MKMLRLWLGAILAVLLVSAPAASPTAIAATAASCSSTTVSYGSRGACAMAAQNALSTAGFSPGSIDGLFYAKSVAATKSFQSAHGLKSDGIIGRHTWAALTGATPSASTPAPAPQPTKPANPGSNWSQTYGPNHTSKVMLTFDDCAPSRAAFRSVIDVAESLGISIAVLPYQQCSTVDAVYARAHGQIVAGHSVSHANLATLSPAGIAKEIDAQSRISGVMRPPYGSMNSTVKSVMAANGIRLWTWSVDTNDWRGKSQAAVVAYVVATARGGDTVLMHMNWHAFNPTALRQIVAGLHGKGLGVCSITAGRQVAALGGRIPNSISC